MLCAPTAAPDSAHAIQVWQRRAKVLRVRRLAADVDVRCEQIIFVFQQVPLGDGGKFDAGRVDGSTEAGCLPMIVHGCFGELRANASADLAHSPPHAERGHCAHACP